MLVPVAVISLAVIRKGRLLFIYYRQTCNLKCCFNQCAIHTE